MAGIDKIRGSQEQWEELYVWLKVNRPQYLRFLFPKEYGYSDYRLISNFPGYADAWLFLHCPISWVTDRIAEQYNLKYKREKYAEV